MLSSVIRILKLSENYSGKLKFAFFLAILESLVVKGPLLLFLYGLIQITTGQFNDGDILFVSILMAVSLGLRALFRHGIHVFQSGTGYNMMADERMKLGNHIRRLPMGYFNDGNIGNISSVITSDMVFLEEIGMEKLTIIVSGYLNLFVSSLMICIFDIRIGLTVLLLIAISVIMLNVIFKKSKVIAPRRQKIIEELINAIIEYAKGMAVTKAFNLSGDKAKATSNSFKKIRDIMIEFEKLLTPLLLLHEVILGIGIGVIVILSSIFAGNGTMEVYFALMMIVFSFEIFVPLMTLSRTIPVLRIVDAGLDRYEKVQEAKPIDIEGKEVKLDRFDIEFDHVTFAYERENVIKDMSFSMEEGSMTALVGKSGCGKSTVANLIARFWDVQQGQVKVGGVDVKDMTCDSLLKHISMVFQKVYLFNDTMLNNIRFAKPEATLEEVMEVCKKARCHEFIMQLEDGYHSMVGEGGCTLSGGEKQRISIARAMLKDAPIVLLDEATASVDPDNEAYIQEAINDLIKNKTLVVIAHKLSTIKNADQILVLDDGKISQRGRHEDLIEIEGYYHDFWKRRLQVKSWTL